MIEAVKARCNDSEATLGRREVARGKAAGARCGESHEKHWSSIRNWSPNAACAPHSSAEKIRVRHGRWWRRVRSTLSPGPSSEICRSMRSSPQAPLALTMRNNRVAMYPAGVRRSVERGGLALELFECGSREIASLQEHRRDPVQIRDILDGIAVQHEQVGGLPASTAPMLDSRPINSAPFNGVICKIRAATAPLRQVRGTPGGD